ncbi:MAG: protein translocase subunit SecD, partial [Actinomycetia bacterium]|nr:protein translocase subunit SecD [Actinomycetes bacterium]
DIKEAAVDRDEFGRIIVRFKTTAEGAAKLAKATSTENKGKRLAISLDDKVRNAPSINETIATGSGNISGGFTYEEAQTLSRIIKEGALPVSLQFIEERTVGPSLGQDSIESGVKAIIIGLIGVMIFMAIYYKLAGLIANFGLVLNMVFMMAILSLLGFTLTLPGIAAFILTVGMAVDANVIIYERIKEEIRAGKSVRMSIVSGFDKAFWTIIDANLTTIIAAFILSQFGTGPIKGFAVTLLIGVLSSMFVALYVTRFIYELISLNKKLKKLSI